jgi:hypothetical protein
MLTLATPGGSQLAKRRSFKSQRGSERSVDSGNVSAGSSPPDTGRRGFNTISELSGSKSSVNTESVNQYLVMSSSSA